MTRRLEGPDFLTPPAFQILLALADQNRHGLGIGEEVEAKTEGGVLLGPGTLYGTIKRLFEIGLIIEAPQAPDPSNDDPRRKYYSITPLGREALAREARRLEIMVHVARSKAVLNSVEGR